MIFLDSVLDRIFICIRNYAGVCINRSRIDDFLIHIIYEYLANKQENVVDCKSGMNQALNIFSTHGIHVHILYICTYTIYYNIHMHKLCRFFSKRNAILCLDMFLNCCVHSIMHTKLLENENVTVIPIFWRHLK